MSTVARERPGQVLPRLGRLVLECYRAARAAPMHARSSGLSTSGALFLWSFSEGGVETFSLHQTCLSLLSAPPHLQQKLPGGLVALRVPPEWSHSLLGWGLFSFFGSSLLFQGLPPPHQWSWSTSPFWLPQPSPTPRLDAGILVRWPGPGQKSRTSCGFTELLDPGKVVGSLWIWGRERGN